MPLLLDTAKSAAAVELRSANCITIGLVNNMPDAALEATERQFVDLVRAAATDCVVRLKLFAMADVPRGARARENLAGRYRDAAELWNERLDGLIVTGTEPRAKDLADEPYWAALTAIVDGAREHTASTIWSCLAAHAAVLHRDGIVRRPLQEKLSGVFDCDTVAALPQLPIGAPRLRVPHSRHNDLPERALTGSGYHILTRSAAAGVDMFARAERHSLFVFLQGHPEYDGGSLLREYRRDVGRFLRGEREHYPAFAAGLFRRARGGGGASVSQARARRTAGRDHARFPAGRARSRSRRRGLRWRERLAPFGRRHLPKLDRLSEGAQGGGQSRALVAAPSPACGRGPRGPCRKVG